MSFTEAIKTCFRKYVTFSGRATRPEYWWFFLFCFLGSTVTSLLDSILFGAQNVVATDNSIDVSTGNGPVSSLFLLVTFLPTLSAGWRRMHDTGRSGLYLFYPIIAIVGIISFASLVGLSGQLEGPLAIIFIPALIIILVSPLIVLWWLTRPSQPGVNEYGPNPHEVSS